MAVAAVLGFSQQGLGQQVKPLATLKGHRGRVWSLAFSPDGRMLASASEDGTIRLWEVLSGMERAASPLAFLGAVAVEYPRPGRRGPCRTMKPAVVLGRLVVLLLGLPA